MFRVMAASVVQDGGCHIQQATSPRRRLRPVHSRGQMDVNCRAGNRTRGLFWIPQSPVVVIQTSCLWNHMLSSAHVHLCCQSSFFSALATIICSFFIFLFSLLLLPRSNITSGRHPIKDNTYQHVSGAVSDVRNETKPIGNSFAVVTLLLNLL